MKIKLDKERREKLATFVDDTAGKIIKAELKTYKETLYSDHVARVYIMSQYSMTAAEPNADEGLMFEAIRHLVMEAKIREMATASEEIAERLAEEPAMVIGILGFLPSKMFRVSEEEIKTNLDLKELFDKINHKGLGIQTAYDDPKYDKYKGYMKDVLTIHYTSPTGSKLYMYDIIVHNDEVLDLPLIDEADNVGGKMAQLKELIEIE